MSSPSFPRVQVFTVPAHSFVLSVDALLNPLKDEGLNMCVGFVYREGSKNSQKWGGVSKCHGWHKTITTHRDGLSRVSGICQAQLKADVRHCTKGAFFPPRSWKCRETKITVSKLGLYLFIFIFVLFLTSGVGLSVCLALSTGSSCRGPRWSTHNSPTHGGSPPSATYVPREPVSSSGFQKH